MEQLITSLFIMGCYFLIALFFYIILYCAACRDYKKSSYTDFNIYLEREKGCLSLMSLAWPFYVAIGGIAIIFEFIENKIRKHYGI